jgi:hypothetical protein
MFIAEAQPLILEENILGCASHTLALFVPASGMALTTL